jgi:hypothetical protein
MVGMGGCLVLRHVVRGVLRVVVLLFQGPPGLEGVSKLEVEVGVGERVEGRGEISFVDPWLGPGGVEMPEFMGKKE